MIVNNKTELQKDSEQKEKREGAPEAQSGDKDRKIAEMIAGQLQVKLWQVEAAVSLIDEGNTIPFSRVTARRQQEPWTMNSFARWMRDWPICAILRTKRKRSSRASRHRES